MTGTVQPGESQLPAADTNGAPAPRSEPEPEARDLILTCGLSPGDILMMSAAVRDLHLAYPGRFRTDLRTSAAEIWENNPYLTALDDSDLRVRTIAMRYDLIHQSNQRPYHFVHGYVRHLEDELGLRIPVTRFHGDVHLSDQEKAWMNQVQEEPIGWNHDFWIIIAGGKYDFTAKWWDPSRYQRVVDHFRGRIQFVQCGEAHHWHPRLSGVIDLVGKTDLRQFIRLMYHAVGVVCPVTFAMHLAAAVEVKPGRAKNRACVVVAGGREPSQWEKYGHHRFLDTNGALLCCDQGGCWKSRCQPVGDGDEKDAPENLCVFPVPVAPDLRIARCMDLIGADDVIRAIELYHRGGAFHYLDDSDVPSPSVP
jgi:ADP-heptose:LPS heptosyltransferase